MRILGSSNPNELYDPLRKAWVAATPEEEVRQQFLQRMLQAGFPPGLIVVEAELATLPHLLGKTGLPARRIDILCYGATIHPVYPLYPLLTVECKATPLRPSAFRQVLGYNYHIAAPFIALTNQGECHIGFLDKESRQYQFEKGLPSYTELISRVCP